MANSNEGSSRATGEDQGTKAILIAIRGVKQQIENLALVIQQSLLQHSMSPPLTPTVAGLREQELALHPLVLACTQTTQHPIIQLNPPFTIDP